MTADFCKWQLESYLVIKVYLMIDLLIRIYLKQFIVENLSFKYPTDIWENATCNWISRLNLGWDLIISINNKTCFIFHKLLFGIFIYVISVKHIKRLTVKKLLKASHAKIIF